jgi:perosamine synthetase
MPFKLPFNSRSHSYNQVEIQTVVEVMQNASPLTQGKHLNSFQKKFCEYMGVNSAFALNNATSALELTAKLCQFQPDDEVIIPSHTYTASAYPFLKKGAKIIWADIDLSTRVVSAQTIKDCITSKTKAIVVVHLYGYCANMPEIMEMARLHNLIVIEDAAQAIGSKINGKMAGTFGDFGVFSFHSHKNITTLGEGGMLIVKDKKIANIVPLLRHHGHCDFNYDRKKYWKPAMGNLDMPELNGEQVFPNNYCLGEVECALGKKLLDRIDQINIEKRHRAIQFIDEVEKFPELEFHRVDSERHNYHLLAGRMLNGKRDIFIEEMAKKGVQCVVQYCPLNRYDFYQKMGYGKAICPSTDLFYDNMVSFPFHHIMSDESFDEMIAITKKVLSELV